MSQNFAGAQINGHLWFVKVYTYKFSNYGLNYKLIYEHRKMEKLAKK